MINKRKWQNDQSIKQLINKHENTRGGTTATRQWQRHGREKSEANERGRSGKNDHASKDARSANNVGETAAQKQENAKNEGNRTTNRRGQSGGRGRTRRNEMTRDVRGGGCGVRKNNWVIRSIKLDSEVTNVLTLFVETHLRTCIKFGRKGGRL